MSLMAEIILEGYAEEMYLKEIWINSCPQFIWQNLVKVVKYSFFFSFFLKKNPKFSWLKLLWALYYMVR